MDQEESMKTKYETRIVAEHRDWGTTYTPQFTFYYSLFGMKVFPQCWLNLDGPLPTLEEAKESIDSFLNVMKKWERGRTEYIKYPEET